MKNIEELSKKAHQHIRINRDFNKLPAAHTHVLPLLVTELLSSGANYPVFLTKNDQTGEFLCIALLGFTENENLYLDQGEWQASHIPLTIDRQPFHINQENKQVYIDIDSPWVDKKQGELIFLENGELSPYMEAVMDNLSKIHSGAKETHAFINTLSEYDLIESIELSITFDDKSSEKLNGLYTINRQKLATLPSDKLIKLHQSGILEGAYIMLNSVEHVKSLVSRKNKRLCK
ncbi:MAG: SapC family protein [Colwellia sp.]|nr:SapC family protein [Colwellia sp.]